MLHCQVVVISLGAVNRCVCILKQTQEKINGKDALRLPYPSQNRSETLADFTLEHPVGTQVHCSLKVAFEYKDDIKPVIKVIPIVYPDTAPSGKVS